MLGAAGIMGGKGGGHCHKRLPYGPGRWWVCQGSYPLGVLAMVVVGERAVTESKGSTENITIGFQVPGEGGRS